MDDALELHNAFLQIPSYRAHIRVISERQMVNSSARNFIL